jgi:ketosteroid isomerase-like protein
MRHERKTSPCSGSIIAATIAAAVFGAHALAQRTNGPAAAPNAVTAPTLDAKAGSAAELLAAQAKLEEAASKGDTAYYASAVSDDMLFVHRIGWITGGKPRTDDKTSYGKRIADKMYLLNELDPTTFQVELHGDIAVTYGRYISMFRPAADEMASMSSIWFERVWAKRDGRWIFLSHRTTHGPSLAPAGVDLTLGTADAKVWYLTDPAPAAVAKSKDETELLKIDQKFADFFTKGDTHSAANGISADFVMVEDEGWTRGQKPLSVDTRETLLKRVTTKHYDVLDFDHVQVEMHGDVAITTGRYLAHPTGGDKANPARAWSAAWFVRVYQKRNGQWIWLSHRTVHGPTYGASREAVSDK